MNGYELDDMSGAAPDAPFAVATSAKEKAKIKSRQTKAEEAQTDKHARRVRASALSSLENCERRYWVQKLPEQVFAAHGITIARRENYKPMMGTLLHAAAEKDMSQDQFITYAEQELRGRKDDFYDALYTSADQVAYTAWGMYADLREDAVSFKPWSPAERKSSVYELGGECRVEHGITLTGTVDCVDSTGRIHDLKTTGRMRGISHVSQMAAYWRIAKENGISPDAQARIVKIGRPRKPAHGGFTKFGQALEPAQIAQPHIVRLFGRLAERWSNKKEWLDDFTSLPCTPGCGHCNFCELKGGVLCPETSGL